jgi:hypothetical protein
MEKFRSKEIVEAVQYFAKDNLSFVKIGRNDVFDRFDDTPDGPYVQGREYKHKVKEGDWIIFRKNKEILVLPTDFFIDMFEKI